MIKKALQFEKNLYDLINSCGLPVETAYYILKTVILTFEQQLSVLPEDDKPYTESQYFDIEKPVRELSKEEKELYNE